MQFPKENLADRLPRFLGACIDIFFIPFVMSYGILKYVGFDMSLLTAPDLTVEILAEYFMPYRTEFRVAAFLYYGITLYFLATRAQTIGKIVVGTRIVDANGAPAPLRFLILRYILILFIGVLPGIGVYLFLMDSMMIFTRKKRCIHDYIARTWVVKA